MALGAQVASLEDRVKALDEQNTVLTEEVLASQSDGFTLVDTEKSYNGFGAAASKVYFSKNPLSVGGYGGFFSVSYELHSNSAHNSCVTLLKLSAFNVARR